MTKNQIEYWKYVEQRRANLAGEAEAARSNIARESETNRANLEKERETRRSNQANELLANLSYQESKRSNMAREAETSRSNQAKEEEAKRSNLANEELKRQANQINLLSTNEAIRANQERERLERDKLSESLRANKANEYLKAQQNAETKRSNIAHEELQGRSVDEQHRSNVARETELSKVDLWNQANRQVELEQSQFRNELALANAKVDAYVSGYNANTARINSNTNRANALLGVMTGVGNTVTKLIPNPTQLLKSLPTSTIGGINNVTKTNKSDKAKSRK